MNDLVTIIFPVFNLDDEYRLPAAKTILKRMSKFDVNVSIIEQLKCEEKSNLYDYVFKELNCDKIKYDIIRIDDDLIHKSEMLNFAANNCNSRFLWFHDADITTDYNRVISKLDMQEFIKPFSAIYKMQKRRTKCVIRDGILRIKSGTRANSYSIAGPHTMIFRRDVFDLIGGFDNRFVGYGWEDIDIAYRALHSIKEESIIEGLIVHFFHKQINPREENTKLLLEKMNIKNLDPLEIERAMYGRINGLGDVVAKAAKLTGISRIAGKIERITKKPCGCGKRRKEYNELLPINKP